MPLIDCPQCGKKVSDSAKACVHCGCELTVTQPQKQEKRETFLKLPENRQKELEREFYGIFSDYNSVLKKFNAVFYIDCALVVIAAVFLFLALFFDDAFVPLVVVFAVFAAAAVGCSIYCKIKRKNVNRVVLLIDKLFVYWLREYKNIDSDVSLTAEQQKLYDSIIITDNDKRRMEDAVR